jgi:hypothetical protein
LDIINELPPSVPEGLDAMVVFTDRVSKQAYFFPSSTRTSPWREWLIYSCYMFSALKGFREFWYLTETRGLRRFFWERLFELLGTQLKFSANYHHQTNGQVERLNQTLANFIRDRCLEHKEDCHRYIPVFEFVYDSIKHTVTGITPFTVVYGGMPPALVSLFNDSMRWSKGATDLASILVSVRMGLR